VFPAGTTARGWLVPDGDAARFGVDLDTHGAATAAKLEHDARVQLDGAFGSAHDASVADINLSRTGTVVTLNGRLGGVLLEMVASAAK
jgi:hypothetical protein